MFKGEFSPELVRRLRPKQFFLVDPWWKLHGRCYPDSGPYTNFGQLETRTAHNMVERSVRRYRDRHKIEIIVDTCEDFLAGYTGPKFDWVYLDTSHFYENTLNELRLIKENLSPHGTIMGDDWVSDPGDWKYGVFRAIQDFTAESEFEVIAAGPELQWAIKRGPVS